MIEHAITLSFWSIAVAMLMAFWRLVRGHSLPDRILALDTLNIDAIALLVLYGMKIGSELYFEAALVLAMLGFFSTLVLSKYILRRDIVE